MKYKVASVVAGLFLLVGLLTLSDYGMNWDGPVQMLRGQAYADVFLNQKTDVDDSFGIPPNVFVPGARISRYYFAAVENGPGGAGEITLPQRPLPQKELAEARKSQKSLSFYHHWIYSGEDFKANDLGHLPFVSVLSAFSNRLFWGGFNFLGDIESYQLVYILLSAVGVMVVTVFAWEIADSWLAGIVAGLVLGLYPLFFAEAHFNMKDPIQASFFAGAVWAFWHWVKENRWRWYVALVAFAALALAVKWNIVFLPLMLLPWLVLIRKTKEFRLWFKPRKLLIVGGVGILGMFIFLIASWPYAWGRPLAAMVETVRFYLESGTGVGIQPKGFMGLGGVNLYILRLLIAQTPEVVLALVIMGVWGVLRWGDKLKTGWLILLWLVVPIVRLSFPGARSYGGVRQIMEVLPAMAVLAGIGAVWIDSRLKIPRKSTLRGRQDSGMDLIKKLTIVAGTTLILIVPIVRLHPNQNVYFNRLVGGLEGAKEKNLIDWTLSWGNIYKQGVEWLNEHAEKDADIAHLDGSMFAISPLWLRDDISVFADHFSAFEQKGEYIMALYNPLDPPVFAKRYPERFLKPIHEIRVDGIGLLRIYKNEKSFSLLEIERERESRRFAIQQKSDRLGDYWEIDLGEKYKITKIWVRNKETDCSPGRYIHELIFFDTADPKAAFALNEKKAVASNLVEYDFPAELAEIVKIYPQSNESCFATGKIEKVAYVED